VTYFQKLLTEVHDLWDEVFGKAGATISASVVTDLHLIGGGLDSALVTFEGLTGLSPNTVASIRAHIAAIVTAATSVATTVETNIAKPVVTQIGADFAALQSVLTGVALPTVVIDVFRAVTTLLPYIEAGVGILTAATVGDAQATGLTADEARLVLGGEAPAAVEEPLHMQAEPGGPNPDYVQPVEHVEEASAAEPEPVETPTEE
jgi:hypothetical protein